MILIRTKLLMRLHIIRNGEIRKETRKSKGRKDFNLHHSKTIITLISKDNQRKTKPNGEIIQTKVQYHLLNVGYVRGITMPSSVHRMEAPFTTFKKPQLLVMLE